VRPGAPGFLRKPVSAKMLADRLTSILVKPRVGARRGQHNGPEPGRLGINAEPSEELERTVVAL
jgi:hypothetical protein